MNWINFDENDSNTFPPEGVNVLISDGIHYDVAYYLLSGEYVWIKIDLEKDDINDFTAFPIIKWCFIE